MPDAGCRRLVLYLREWLVEREGWRRTGRTALASWVLPRLTEPPGLVCGSVPDGFAAYARVCHPVPDGAGGSLTWRDVGRVTGAGAHPLMQWHTLIGAASPYDRSSARWDGDSPASGNPDNDAFQRFAVVLRRHTRADDDCVCGDWVGYTYDDATATITATRTKTGTTGGTTTGQAAPSALQPPSHMPEQLRVADPPAGPDVVHHPNRDYELFTGPLHTTTGTGWSRRSPQLLWPADHTWCVATEVDFDSTLVAGDHALIDDLLAEARLDAWPVLPTDSLRFDADTINHDLDQPPY